jgi:hypothetical protein
MIFETILAFLTFIIGFLFCDIVYKKMFDVSIWNRPEKPVIPQEKPVIPISIEPNTPLNLGGNIAIDLPNKNTEPANIPLPQNGGNNV